MKRREDKSGIPMKERKGKEREEQGGKGKRRKEKGREGKNK